MSQVVEKALDATVQDTTAANWYLKTQPKEYRDLRTVGEAVKPSKYPYFVIFVRKNQGELLAQLDDAVRESLRDGSMKRILEKYDLWDADQAGLLDAGSDWPPKETSERPPFWWFARQLGWASLTTILLAVVSFPLAMGLWPRRRHRSALRPPLAGRWPLGVYVELIRGTPLLLQLISDLLPLALRPSISLSRFEWAAALGLALNYAAYEAEIYRAGLLAVPRGQREAALSLGMSSTTALWRILVPQAVRTVVPPVTNDFIALFKDTSVCSVIAVAELTARYRSFATNNPALILELGLMTAFLYLAMSYPLSLVSRRLERAQKRRAVGQTFLSAIPRASKNACPTASEPPSFRVTGPSATSAARASASGAGRGSVAASS